MTDDGREPEPAAAWVGRVLGPLGAGVYVEPGVAFMSPAIDYAAPASTWAPVYPETLEVVAPAGDIDVGPAATGAEVGVP